MNLRYRARNLRAGDVPPGVHITPNGEFAARIAGIYLGRYETPEDAADAYITAAKEFYGEFFREPST
jgi:hypothetical protein